MNWLRAMWSEAIGLFVDDGWLALAALVWLVLAGLVLPRLSLGWLGPVLLFAGLAGILVESAVRGALPRTPPEDSRPLDS